MKTSAKFPPPDSVLNLQGRIYQLRVQAHVQAVGGHFMVVTEENVKGPVTPFHPPEYSPQEYAQRFALELKNLAPEFKTLEQRIQRCSGQTVKSAIVTEILTGDSSQEPLSREKALAKGVAQQQSANALLDFMQRTLGS